MLKSKLSRFLNASLIIAIIIASLTILNCRTISLAADNFNAAYETISSDSSIMPSIKSGNYRITPMTLPLIQLYGLISYELKNEYKISNNISFLKKQEIYIQISNENSEDIKDLPENPAEDISFQVEDIYNETEAIFISKLNTSNKKLTLTFDDCNNRANIKSILDILSKNNVKGTFFVTGDTVEDYPDLLNEIVDNGNAIGNHSYYHKDFTALSYEEIKDEVEKLDEAIKNLTGKSTKPLFRPPYGSFNDDVINSVGSLGYTDIVYWSIDTRDWSGISADKIAAEILTKVKPGTIVLMHASYGAKHTAEALPDIIKGLKDMGYDFVTLDE